MIQTDDYVDQGLVLNRFDHEKSQMSNQTVLKEEPRADTG